MTRKHVTQKQLKEAGRKSRERSATKKFPTVSQSEIDRAASSSGSLEETLISSKINRIRGVVASAGDTITDREALSLIRSIISEVES